MKKLGRYHVQRKEEAAGGPVYVASEAGSGRPAALKLVRFTEDASSDKLASMWAHLYEEVRAAAALQHPNIAQVFEVFQDEGKTWIATELASGKNLANLLAEGSPPAGTIVDVLRQTAGALDYAHAKGLLHRTVRPASLGVQPNGTIRVFGFGLAQYFLEAPDASSPADLAYLAPELIRGETLTARCDQFSLAAIAYEMLTGEAPFQGTAEQIRSSIIEQEPLPADGLNPAIGPAAARVLARGLAKRPEERYGGCGEFVAALERALSQAPGWSTGEPQKPRAAASVESIEGRPKSPKVDLDSLVEDLVSELSGRGHEPAVDSASPRENGSGQPKADNPEGAAPQKAQHPDDLKRDPEPAHCAAAAKDSSQASEEQARQQKSEESRKVFLLGAAAVVLALGAGAWLYFGYGFGRTPSPAPAVVEAAPFSVTTESLPAAAPGTAYRHALEASGGAAPLVWQVEGELPPGFTFNAASGTIEGIPRVAGNYPFRVAVTDAGGQQASQSFDLHVQLELTVKTPAALPSGVVGQLYRQELRAEGGSEPLRWELAGGTLPAGVTLNSDGLIVGRPQSAGTFPFQAKVGDAANSVVAQAFSLRIGSGLTLLSAAELPFTSVGTPYAHQLAAGGGSPPYRWSLSGGVLPQGLSLEESGAIRGQPTSAGRFNFEVMVHDRARASAVQSFRLEIRSALRIVTPAALADANLNRVYSKPLELEGGNWPYRWALAGGTLPPGLQLDEFSGTVRGTPSLAGSYEFDIQVADAFRAVATQHFRLAVTTLLEIQTAYDLPEAAGSGVYSHALRAAGGRPPYLWKVQDGSLPNDFTLDSTTGVLSGVPTTRGDYRFTVEVSDGLGTKANRLFRLSVIPALHFNDRGTLPPAIAGEHYTQALGVSGGLAPHAWTVQEGELPAGASLDQTTGVVEGTPQAPGRYRFAVQVADAKGSSVRQFFELDVKPPAPGEMIWRGNLPKDGVLIIQDGRYASVGTVTGALPGVPIKIDLEPREGLTVVTAPARANNWKVLVINASQPQTEIIIRWSPLSSQ